MDYSSWLVIAYTLTVLGVIGTVLSENRNPLKASAWILIVGLIPVLGIMTYIVFGQDQRRLHSISRRFYRRLMRRPQQLSLSKNLQRKRQDTEEHLRLIELIQRNEVIVIDSFAKLQELNPRFLLDRDLRKKYDGKLFLLIYQLTGEGKMRGGSKSEFDGDIILLTHVAPDYRENYIYPSKNRYNALPATQLRYSTYFQQMLDIPKELGTGRQPTEAISLPPAPQTNVYEVIY